MIDIREVVETLQSDLRNRGINYLSTVRKVNSNLMITCPYHKNGQEKTPSCGILLETKASRDKVHKAGTVHCFTCGETHTLEELISYVYGIYDKGAYGTEWLLEKFGILSTDDITFDCDFVVDKEVSVVNYKEFKQYHPYFASRGISERVAEAFDLGYDEFHDSVVIPHFDKVGNCIMLIKRSIKEHVYMNTSGSAKTDSVYGIHMIYKKLEKLVDNEYVFVVEGAFDALKLWQHGYPAVGILQASISDNQVNLISQLPFQKIVIATDNDEAGRRVALQLAKKLSKTKEVYFMTYPSGVKDPGEMTPTQLKELEMTQYGESKQTGFTSTLY